MESLDWFNSGRMYDVYKRFDSSVGFRWALLVEVVGYRIEMDRQYVCSFYEVTGDGLRTGILAWLYAYGIARGAEWELGGGVCTTKPQCRLDTRRSVVSMPRRVQTAWRIY